MNKKKSTLIIMLLAILLGVFIIWGVKAKIETDLKSLSAVDISDVDLSKLKDGVYSGSYKVFPVAAEVKVIISNHTVAEIELIKHTNGQGSAAEVIPEKVIEAQSLEIDTVAGATYSSKVILKAIEDALKRADKE